MCTGGGGGGGDWGGGRQQCGNCEGWASRRNYARHLRNCRGRVVSEGGGKGLLGIGGSVRSSAGCSQR